MKIALYKTFKL